MTYVIVQTATGRPVDIVATRERAERSQLLSYVSGLAFDDFSWYEAVEVLPGVFRRVVTERTP